ncbi:MAG: hypothetical protein JXJ18_01930 [Rhodobacteraceae bacterium]|nr:hypothetical protein [Paracoccaceae bacterium]
MNANGLINMAVRIVMRKLMNKGVDAGIDLASRRGQGAQHPDAPPDPKLQARTRETRKRAQQAMKIARRMGRF